jgi:RNA polymerase sigma-70 factor (ECF subfamily)
MSDALSPEQQSSLVARLLAGDDGAEAELVTMFHGRLRTMFSARVHDRDMAQDLAQEALLAAITGLRAGSLRDPERLAAFVYGIGRNLANNYLRRRQSGTEVPLDPDSLVDNASAEALHEQERLQLAQRALAVLDSTDRHIILLTLVEGLKPGEIASRLKLGAEAVRARKSRALKKVVAEVERLSRIAVRGH